MIISYHGVTFMRNGFVTRPSASFRRFPDKRATRSLQPIYIFQAVSTYQVSSDISMAKIPACIHLVTGIVRCQIRSLHSCDSLVKNIFFVITGDKFLVFF